MEILIIKNIHDNHQWYYPAEINIQNNCAQQPEKGLPKSIPDHEKELPPSHEDEPQAPEEIPPFRKDEPSKPERLPPFREDDPNAPEEVPPFREDEQPKIPEEIPTIDTPRSDGYAPVAHN